MGEAIHAHASCMRCSRCGGIGGSVRIYRVGLIWSAHTSEHPAFSTPLPHNSLALSPCSSRLVVAARRIRRRFLIRCGQRREQRGEGGGKKYRLAQYLPRRKTAQARPWIHGDRVSLVHVASPRNGGNSVRDRQLVSA